MLQISVIGTFAFSSASDMCILCDHSSLLDMYISVIYGTFDDEIGLCARDIDTILGQVISYDRTFHSSNTIYLHFITLLCKLCHQIRCILTT